MLASHREAENVRRIRRAGGVTGRWTPVCRATLLVLLVGGAAPPALPEPDAAATVLQDPILVLNHEAGLRPPGDRLRISSYNIQDFTDGVDDGHQRTPTVTRRHAETAARIVSEIGPDILLVQEIENPRILEEFNRLIEPPFPLGYITTFDVYPGGRSLNIALLSRVPILKIREIDFEHAEAPVSLTRGAIAFVVDLAERNMLLGYGVHLKSNFGKLEGRNDSNIAKRQEALKVLRAHADLVVKSNPSRAWHVLVAGDMNVDPELPDFASDASLEPLSDWVDLWLGRPLSERITIPTRYGDPDLEFPSACFDRIIVSPELANAPWQVGRMQVLQRGVDTENVFTLAGQNEIHVSDHYPVYMDIER